MDNGVKGLIQKTLRTFPHSFINESNELILEPVNNLYFRLEDIKSEIDFKCKMLAWLSRPISKSLPHKQSEKMLDCLNEVLGTLFTQVEMIQIYKVLGNDVNRALCESFVESKYTLKKVLN